MTKRDERPPHRVVVVPWLRWIGGIVLRRWVAITLGSTVLAWRALTEREVEHELEHVRQWQRHGALFAVRYLVASWTVRRRGGHWYHDNPYEIEARAAAERAITARPTPR